MARLLGRRLASRIGVALLRVHRRLLVRRQRILPLRWHSRAADRRRRCLAARTGPAGAGATCGEAVSSAWHHLRRRLRAVMGASEPQRRHRRRRCALGARLRRRGVVGGKAARRTRRGAEAGRAHHAQPEVQLCQKRRHGGQAWQLDVLQAQAVDEVEQAVAFEAGLQQHRERRRAVGLPAHLARAGPAHELALQNLFKGRHHLGLGRNDGARIRCRGACLRPRPRHLDESQVRARPSVDVQEGDLEAGVRALLPVLEAREVGVEQPVEASGAVAPVRREVGVHDHVGRLRRLPHAHLRAAAGHQVADRVLVDFEEGGLDRRRGAGPIKRLVGGLLQLLDNELDRAGRQAVQLTVREEAGEGVGLPALGASVCHDRARCALQAGEHGWPDDLEELLLLPWTVGMEEAVEAQRLARLALLRAHLDACFVLQHRDQGRRLLARPHTANELRRRHSFSDLQRRHRPCALVETLHAGRPLGRHAAGRAPFRGPGAGCFADAAARRSRTRMAQRA
mmetsp:Transcript_18094/g.46665  ORF Transcript_18094/g.46665 Transcript_18094/m.46665 type:complete len:510 (+) Transcript_18094:1885-3414(+)